MGNMTVNVELINGCNEHCASCVHDDSIHFMNEDVFTKMLQAIKPDNVEQYRLYGNGETMLHPEITKLLKKLPHNVPSILKTNGTASLDDYAMVAPLIGKLLICLDGITQKCHGHTRTSDAEKTLHKATELAKIFPNIGVYTLVHELNWKEAISLFELGRREGLNVELSPFVPIQIGTNKPIKVGVDWLMTPKSREEYLKYFRGQDCKITTYNWVKKETTVYGVMVSHDGGIMQCLGRRRPTFLPNIKQLENVEMVKKNCAGCPVNTLTQDYILPPHVEMLPIGSGTEEINLRECALDPYH